MLRLPRNPIGREQGNSGFAQTCSSEKAVTWPAEGGTEIVAYQGKVLYLTFSGIVNCLLKKKFY